MESDRPRPKWIPYFLVGLGSAALVAPFLVARRARRVSLELSSAPPVRNVPNKSPARSLNTERTSNIVQEDGPQVSFLPALARAVGALGASTLAVGGTAFVGVYAIHKAWGVNSIPEFSKRMRIELATRFPGFAKVMESSLTGDIMEEELNDPSLDEWDYDGSKDRLMKAFSEGGLNRLTEVAWEEMQTESRVLLRKRRREQNSYSPT